MAKISKTGEKQAWKSRTIAKYEVSENVEWAAQRLKAPDGTVFVGLRRFIRKADDMIPDSRCGFVMKEDKNTAKTLRKLSSMLAELAESVKEHQT
jgi:hypothetical protein